LAGEVDESVTGSASFFWSKTLAGLTSNYTRPRAMAFPPRPPAFSPGFQALLWGVGLGAFIWIGGLAVGVAGGTAFLFGVVGAVLIFFYVRLYGEDPLRP